MRGVAGTLAAAPQLMPGKKQMVQAAPSMASPAPQGLRSRWLRRSTTAHTAWCWGESQGLVPNLSLRHAWSD